MKWEVRSTKYEVGSGKYEIRGTKYEVKRRKQIKSVTTCFITNENLCFFVKTVSLNDTSKKYT